MAPRSGLPVASLAVFQIHVSEGWGERCRGQRRSVHTPRAVCGNDGKPAWISYAGVLAFGGRLSKLALGLRTGVRVGLDVDNWLREHPRGVNPTARICARYVSIARYIAQ